MDFLAIVGILFNLDEELPENNGFDGRTIPEVNSNRLEKTKILTRSRGKVCILPFIIPLTSQFSA